MARTNDEAAALLQEMADLMAMLGKDPFRTRAYEKAAAAVAAHPNDLDTLDLKGIQSIPSVGKNMASRLEEFLQSGTIGDLEAMRNQIPPGVLAMTRIPGLGPKRAMLLFRDMGIDSVEALVAAIKGQTLRGVKGFGSKTEENILRGIKQITEHGSRVLVDRAYTIATGLIAALSDMRQVSDITYAGSLRRMRETIGDVDLLVASHDAAPIMDRFTSLPDVAEILAKGDTKSSIITDGLQVDLRVVDPDAWGAALLYFTGSKAHNIKIREMAVRAGLKLNEYGLFKVEDESKIAARSESDVYEALGLQWIPPAMREDAGEIDAAKSGTIPDVIQEKDLRGDLHTHTTMTDGHGTLEEMVAAAAGHGYAYYVVTDHAGDYMQMQRTTREKFLEQRAAIDKLQRKYPKMTILQGLELNIQPDGTVDYDPEFLATFDLCVASMHSHFTLDKATQTKRVTVAMENPNVHVIGHLTGRQIGRRAPIDLDFEHVCDVALTTGTALEINSHPDRLDLSDDHARLASQKGVMVSIDSDAHAVGHLDGIRYGVGTAQRGWTTRNNVLNAGTLKQLQQFVARKRAR